MSLDLTALMDAAASHAAASGHFDRVAGHEPRNAPGNGLSCAFWLESLRPIPARSGLASTSVRLELSARLYTPMTREPQDSIDPTLVAALDALMRAYSGDFDLDGRISHVDLLGAYGDPLQARAGYLDQDGTKYRVLVLTLPLIINDLWEQAS